MHHSSQLRGAKQEGKGAAGKVPNVAGWEGVAQALQGVGGLMEVLPSDSRDCTYSSVPVVLGALEMHHRSKKPHRK